jgi:uncharacterized membrane protein HdeD (DUF308 family)
MKTEDAFDHISKERVKQYYAFVRRRVTIEKALNTHHLDHTSLNLNRVEVRASGLWRTLEILGGIIVIALAIFAIADPQFTIQTVVIVIAAGLIIGGLFRITIGAFATVLPSPLRGFNITGGVIAFVLGIAALLDLQAAVATLIGILAVALLLVGALEIGVGVARHPPVWLRVVIVAIGVLTIILSAYVILDTSIGQGILAAILAFALLLVGIRNIVHGVTGHHSIARSVEAAVTAA